MHIIVIRWLGGRRNAVDYYSNPTDRLLDPHQYHTLGEYTVRVVEMQQPKTWLKAVQSEASPCREIIAEALVIHDLEPVHAG
jgi:hypothetical protein